MTREVRSGFGSYFGAVAVPDAAFSPLETTTPQAGLQKIPRAATRPGRDARPFGDPFVEKLFRG
jgi:hypothetical protein